MTLRAFVGSVALTAGSAIAMGCVAVWSAEAADLTPSPRPAPAAPIAYAPPFYNWSGFYVGGEIGGGFSNSSWSDPFTPGSRDRINKSGFLGGGEIGANAQFNRLVVGVEGDWTWTGLKGSGKDSVGDTINSNVDWTSTVTGRLGAAFDRVLVYGKGGAAFANDKDSLNSPVFGTQSATMTRTGWTAGGGVEYGIDRNWSAKVEYDYLGFGSQALNLPAPTTTLNDKLNVQEVKAGVNYRFGAP
ncbi:MAG TPA: outer membrane protein [Xanthobacteraceae bacterium]